MKMCSLQCFVVVLSLLFHHARTQGSGEFTFLFVEQSATIDMATQPSATIDMATQPSATIDMATQPSIPSLVTTKGSNFLMPDPSVSEIYMSPVVTTRERMLPTQTLTQDSGMTTSNAFLFVDPTPLVMETSVVPSSGELQLSFSTDLTMSPESSLMTGAVTDLLILPTDTQIFLGETASVQLEPLTTMFPLLSTLHTLTPSSLETASSHPSLGSLSTAHIFLTPSPPMASLRVDSTFTRTRSANSLPSELFLFTSVTQSLIPSSPFVLTPSSSLGFLFLPSSGLFSSIAVSSSRPLLVPLETSEVNNLFSSIGIYSTGTSSPPTLSPLLTLSSLPSTLPTHISLPSIASTFAVGQSISDTIVTREVTEFIFLQTTQLFDTTTTTTTIGRLPISIVPSAVLTSSTDDSMLSLSSSGNTILTSDALFPSPMQTSVQILESQFSTFTTDLLTPQSGTTHTTLTPVQSLNHVTSSSYDATVPGPTPLPTQFSETTFSPTLSQLLPISSPRARSDALIMSTSMVFFVDPSSDILLVTSPSVVSTVFPSETLITPTSVTTIPISSSGTPSSATASPTQLLPVPTMLSGLFTPTAVSSLTSSSVSQPGQTPNSTQPTIESIASTNVISVSVEIIAASTFQGLLPLTALPTVTSSVKAVTSSTSVVDPSSTRAQISFTETTPIQIQTSAGTSSLGPSVTSPIQTSAGTSSLGPSVTSPIQTSAGTSSLGPSVTSPIQSSAGTSSLGPSVTRGMSSLFETSTSVSSVSSVRETLSNTLHLGSLTSNVVQSTISISLDGVLLTPTSTVGLSSSDVSPSLPSSIQPTTTSTTQSIRSSVVPVISTSIDTATLKSVEMAITTHFPSSQPMAPLSTTNPPPSRTTIGSSTSSAVSSSTSSMIPSPLPSPMVCPSLFTLGTIIPVTALVDIQLALTRVEHQSISLPGMEGRCGLEDSLTQVLIDYIRTGTRISRRQASGIIYDADITTVSALSMGSAVVTFYIINGTSGEPLLGETIVSVFTVISPQQINTYPVITGATIHEEVSGTEVPVATDSIVIPLVAGVGGVIVFLLIAILVSLCIASVWQRKKGHIAVQAIETGERGTFVRTNDFGSYNRPPSSQSTPKATMTTRRDPVTLSHLANGSLEIDSDVPVSHVEMEGSLDSKEESRDPVSGGLFEHVAHYSTPPQPSHRTKRLKMRFRRSVAPSPSTSDRSQHSKASDDINIPVPAALKPKARSKVNEMEAKRLREDALRLQEQHEEDELKARRQATLQRMVLLSRQREGEDISRGGNRRKETVVSLADPRSSTFGGVAWVSRHEEVDAANLGDVEATTPTATPTADLPAATPTLRHSTKRRVLRRKATNRIAPLQGTTDEYKTTGNHRTARHSKKFKSGRSQRGRPLTQSGLPTSGRSSRGVAKDVRQELTWMNTGNGVQLMSIQPIAPPPLQPQLISMQPRPPPVAWEKLPSLNQVHSQNFTQRQLETYLKIHQDMQKLQLDNSAPGATPTTTQATPTQTTTQHEGSDAKPHNVGANQRTSADTITVKKGDSIKVEDPPSSQARSNLDSSYSSTVQDLTQQAFLPTGMRQDNTIPWQPEHHTMNSAVAWHPTQQPTPHLFTPAAHYTPQYSTLQPQTGHLVWNPETTNSRHVQPQMISPAQLSQLRMTPGISLHSHDNSNYGNPSSSYNSQWVDPPGYSYY